MEEQELHKKSVVREGLRIICQSKSCEEDQCMTAAKVLSLDQRVAISEDLDRMEGAALTLGGEKMKCTAERIRTLANSKQGIYKYVGYKS